MDRHVQYVLEAQLHLIEQDLENSFKGELDSSKTEALRYKMGFCIQSIECTIKLYEHYLCTPQHDQFVYDLIIYLNNILKHLNDMVNQEAGEYKKYDSNVFDKCNVAKIKRLRVFADLLSKELASSDANRRNPTDIGSDRDAVEDELYKRLGISTVLSNPLEMTWDKALQVSAAAGNSLKNAA